MKTKAAILVEQNKPLVVAQIEIPRLERGQVLVRVSATAICGSQLGEIDGVKGADRFLPHLLGHEASGIVEEIGEGVTRVKPGDFVVLHWRPGPGLEGKPPVYLLEGKKVNAGRVTTFQERSVVSENRLTVLSEKIDPVEAALYGCCLTTGFGVVEKDARLQKGESVLILGSGGVGLAAVMASRVNQASLIVAVDRDRRRLDLALELGATHAIDTSKEDLPGSAARILGEKRADVVIENTGIRSFIEMGYELCADRGRTILVGVPRHGEKASLDTLPLHFGKVLTGSHGGQTDPATDIPRCLERRRQGLFDPMRLVSDRFPLERIHEAIEGMRDGRQIRPVIIFKG